MFRSKKPISKPSLKPGQELQEQLPDGGWKSETHIYDHVGDTPLPITPDIMHHEGRNLTGFVRGYFIYRVGDFDYYVVRDGLSNLVHGRKFMDIEKPQIIIVNNKKYMGEVNYNKHINYYDATLRCEFSYHHSTKRHSCVAANIDRVFEYDPCQSTRIWPPMDE